MKETVMFYAPFFTLFPEVAVEDKTSITVSEELSTDAPAGEYMVLDSHCTEPNCDCRRAFLSVYTENDHQLLATISFGWEEHQFYVKWFGRDDWEAIANIKGPMLADGQAQSRFAPQFLKLVVDLVLCDPAYIEQLKEHYRMFKSAVKKPQSRRSVH